VNAQHSRLFTATIVNVGSGFVGSLQVAIAV